MAALVAQDGAYVEGKVVLIRQRGDQGQGQLVVQRWSVQVYGHATAGPHRFCEERREKCWRK